MKQRPQQTLVRASDVGQWAYCHRAWWLARVRNAPHQRPERLARGTHLHEAHGRTMARAQQYRHWAHRIFAAALLLLGLLLLLWLIQSGT